MSAAEEAAMANDDGRVAALLAAADERWPDSRDVAFFRFGWTYLRGRPDEALALATAWLTRHPDDEDFARARVGLFLEMNREEEALAAVNEWLAAHLNDRGWLYTKGDILAKLGRVDDACAMIDAQLAAAPAAYEWLYYKADLLKKAGRDDDALTTLEELVKVEDSAEVYFEIAALYFNRPEPNYGRAIAAYEAGFARVAENLRPSFANQIYNLACAYARQGEKDKALALVAEALAAEPLLARDAEGDPNLTSLRGSKAFANTLAEAAEKAEAAEREHMTIKPGEPAPTFALKGIDGKEYSLADFRGQFVVLNIWATWCGPCRREIPEIIAFAHAHEGEATVISISVDAPATDLATFAAEQGINYLILKDDGVTAAKYLGENGGIPQTYFIDKEGVVRGHIYGSAEKATFEGRLKKMTNGRN